MREVAGCPGTIIFHLSPSQTIIAEPGCQNCGADTFPTTPPLAIRVTDSEAMGGGAEVGQGHKPQRTLQSPYAREGRPGSRGHAPATRRDRYAHIWQPRTRPRGSPLRQENRIMGASKARVARFASPCATSDPRVPNRLLSLSLPSSSSLRPPRQMIGSLALLLALPHLPPPHPFLRPSPSRLRGREERCVSANSLSLSPACRQPPAAHWAPSYRHPYNQPWPEGRGIRDACPPSRVDALSLP